MTATTTVGRGNHVFYGSARDLAGNVEEPYQIAQVIWFPLASPELGESSIEVSPAAVRPGEEVTVTLSLRNSGQQEAWVAMQQHAARGDDGHHRLTRRTPRT